MYNNIPCAIDVAITSTDPETYARDVKHKKYDKGFKDTGIEFIAAVVDTFGLWSSEGESILEEIIRRGAKRLISDHSTFVTTAWQQITCSFQIHNARTSINRICPPDSTIIKFAFRN